jgi:1,4-alpha-glucan branching enzyme
LVEKAHDLGLKVILDIINNHASPDHPFIADSYNWRDVGYHNWFHPRSFTSDFTSIKDEDWKKQSLVETLEFDGLPDFKQSNPHVYDYLLDVSKYWIRTFNIDGFRLDTVRHIEKDYWQKYNKDIKEFAGENFLLLGEVFQFRPKEIGRYLDLGFDSLFDFPLMGKVRSVFAEGRETLASLTSALESSQSTFKNQEFPALMLDNHDMKRFASLAVDNPAERIKLAMTFISSLNGIPLMYQGTEIAQSGGDADYLNRQMMNFSKVDENNSENLVTFLSRLSLARKNHAALFSGDIIELYKDKLHYVFAKINQEEIVVVALNAGKFQSSLEVPLRPDMFQDENPDTLYQRAYLKLMRGELGQSDAKIITENTLRIELPAMSADIFSWQNSSGFKVSARTPFSVREASFQTSEVKLRIKHQKSFNKVELRPDYSALEKNSRIAMKLDLESNEWTYTASLPAGVHYFSFLINDKIELLSDIEYQSAQKNKNYVIISGNGRIEPSRVNFSYPATGQQTVALIGDFNNWDLEKALKMTLNSDNNVWETSTLLPPGNYLYQYLIDDTERVVNPQEAVANENGETFNIAIITLSGTAKKQRILFEFNDDKNGLLESVALVGDFTSWEEKPITLSYDKKSSAWRGEVELLPGEYSYSYVTNGKDWILDSDEPVVAGYGGAFDHKLIVNNEGRAPLLPVEISYPDISAGVIKSIHVVGEFNRWQENSHPLQFNERRRQWELSIGLLPGEYRYKYLINKSEFVSHPSAQLAPYDGSGTNNNNNYIIVDSSGPLAPIKVMFNYKATRTDIRKVQVAGDFNNFNLSRALNLVYNAESGLWQGSMELLPGSYQFKYALNGIQNELTDWITPPEAEQFTGPYQNGVLKVGAN